MNVGLCCEENNVVEKSIWLYGMIVDTNYKSTCTVSYTCNNEKGVNFQHTFRWWNCNDGFKIIINHLQLLYGNRMEINSIVTNISLIAMLTVN